MSRKALFFDVDGTLLSEINHSVPDSAVRALAIARARGHLVFINSGRVYCHIGPIMEDVEADGYLCGCGTCVVVGGQILYSARIPHERGIQIKKDIVNYGLDGVLEAREAMYFRKETSHIAEVENLREAIVPTGHVSDLSWDDDSYDFDKFCVLADENSDKEGFFKSMKPDIEVIDRGNDFYECVPAGHSKATAIEIVLKKYNIPLEDAYVFGDSTNDLAMFQYAKNAVLMGHHDKELEPYATFITKTVEDDGIEYALKELKII